jgi:TPP-dependent pyruvate/acetoin dehydrogenase alpha subunit
MSCAGSESARAVKNDHDELLRLYWFMRLTRAVEDRTRALYFEGKIVGAVYTGAGMEAVSVGAASALQPGDVVAPLHRDLGAHLVRGTTLREVFAQWLGRASAPTGGRDGRIQIGDMCERMIVPATSILGATLPVAVGTALAAKIRGEGRVTLAFIGEGGTSTGDFHEALNLATAAWLPFVCVVEQNGYAYSTPAAAQARIASFAERATAYGIPSASVDGNDVLAVYDAVRQAIARARDGGGPALVEARTFRVRGHSEADEAAYVPPELLAEWAARDPIARFEAYLREHAALTAEEQAKIAVRLQAEIDEAIDEAVAYAEAAPPPDPASLIDHVFADDGSGRIKPRRVPETPPAGPLGPDRPPKTGTAPVAGAAPIEETVGRP